MDGWIDIDIWIYRANPRIYVVDRYIEINRYIDKEIQIDRYT